MKLKEIALSIYYEPYVYGMDSNNYSSKEEYLNDSRNFFHEVLFPIKKQFIMETRNIASFFSRLHFENYKNNQYPFSKLIVSCCRDKCSIGRIINVDGIAEVRILYDYTGFRNKNAIQKKHDALQIIMNGLYVVANEFLLDTISFKNIESMIISCDYKNIWTWSSKWNKNRKYNASVYVDHDVDSVIIGMKIVDKSGTMIYNKKILTTKPDEWDYAPFLGKLFWQNNNEAVLLDKNDKVVGKWSAEQFSVYRQKPIEEIQIGDRVLSEDETTGEVAVKTVTETYINETDELIHIGVNGETISATPTHPFYVDKLGWTLAGSLRAGDVLVLSNGELVTVEWVQHEILESPIKVYNFEVEDFHTYFVGECGVLVHNECKTDWGAAHTKKNENHNNAIEIELDNALANGANKSSIRKNKWQVDANDNYVLDSRGKHRRPDASYVIDETRYNTNYVSNPNNAEEVERELEAFIEICNADPDAVVSLIFEYQEDIYYDCTRTH